MEQEIISLFQKYMDRQCNANELEEVLLIIEQGKHQEEWEVALSNDAIKIMHSDADFKNMDDATVATLNARILQTVHDEQIITHLASRKAIWVRFAVAASILLIATVGLYFFSHKFSNDHLNLTVYEHDIAPGGNGATLTLANGQQILLKDALAGNIATQSGVKISKTADGQLVYTVISPKTEDQSSSHAPHALNTLTTTCGEQIQVQLPDGSHVFLNAASSLKYPTSFAKSDKRRVVLTGEGYFEVAKDKTHPFVVESRGQQVEVLGTHFNINSYADEREVKTTLQEGSVRITPFPTATFNKLNPIMLKPGEQASLTASNVQINQADVNEALAWKNGDFIFNNEDLASIMRKVEKWYNVEFIYNKKTFKNLKIWGKVARSKNISSVLNALELTGKLKFKIDPGDASGKGRRIMIIE